MAVATREMRPEATTRAPHGARPAAAPRPASVAVPEPPAAAQSAHAGPRRSPDYDAPMSPWPLVLYLLFVLLAVNAAFVWAGLRAAGVQ